MAAQDAELRLKVSLDLAFFRQQLAGLGQAAAGYNLPLNVKLDRSVLTKELRNLERAVGKKKINVELNILGGLTGKQLTAIQDRLEALSKTRKVEVPVSVKNGATGQDISKTIASIKGRIGSNQQIKQGGGKLRVPLSVKPSITNADVADFKRAIREKFSGISVKVKADIETGGRSFAAGPTGLAGLQEYMRTQGMSGGNVPGAAEIGRRAQFEKAINEATSKELKRMLQTADVAQRSKLTTKAQMQEALLKINDVAMENILGNLKMQMQGPLPIKRSFLDQVARAVFWMAGVDPAYLRQQAAQRRALPFVDFPSTVPQRNISIGPSKSGRALPPASTQVLAGLIPGARPPAGLLPSLSGRSQTQAIVEALIAQQGPRMLPPGGGTLVDTKRIYAELQKNLDNVLRRMFTVLEADAQETGMGIQYSLKTFAYLAQALQDAEGRTKAVADNIKESRIANEVENLIDKIEAMLRLAAAQVNVRQVKIGIGAPMQAALPSAERRVAGLLPPARQPAPAEEQVRVSGGYNRPAPLEVRPFYRAPNLPGGQGSRARLRPQMVGQEVPRGPIGGGPERDAFIQAAKGALQLDLAAKIARKSLEGFRASQLPLIGGLKEIGGEFAMATKQVLLYGTAYKGLAFITSLPGQVLNAAKSQQQFNNALQTATQDTGTFAKELLYVDNVQRAFGLNLETTRSGFTKLYASMAPTGFDSGSIEKLFTGISAATAALQLTPDKAERVIYAFGQMANKGQIMSEELKGQLGDVLPGALALFADAAGMSVKEFSAAMEKGEFVGGKFRDTFAKVSDELMKRFGTGAQAAGKSLQGLINTVQSDFARTLESFSPLANAAAQAILIPLGGALKQLSVSAQLATGELERTFTQLQQAQKDLASAKAGGDIDQIRAAEQSVAALTVRYEALQQAAADPAIAKQTKDIQLFTKELTKAGTFVMNVAKTIGGMLSPILGILGTNLTTVISLLTSFYIGLQTTRLFAMALMGILLTYRTLSAILGFGPAALGANALAAAFNGLGVAATGAQVKMVGLGRAMTAFTVASVAGLAVAGILAIAGALATMRDRAKEAREESQRAIADAGTAASMGRTMEVTASLNAELAKNRVVAKGLATLREIYAIEKDRMKMGGKPIITVEQMASLDAAAKYSNEIAGVIAGRQLQKGQGYRIQPFQRPELSRAERQAGQITAETRASSQLLKVQQKEAQRIERELGLNKPTLGATAAMDQPSDKDAAKALRNAEQLAKQVQQRRIEEANFANDMQRITFDRDVQLSDAAFEHKKSLIDALNEYELSGLNDMQARQLKFAQDLKKIQLSAIDVVRKELQKANEAQMNVVAARRTAEAAGKTSAGGMAIFGETGRVSNAKGWVHGHFQTNTASLATLIGDVVPVVKQLLSQGIPVELSGGQKFNTRMSDAEITALLRKGAAQHSHSGDGRSIDLFVPKGTTVPAPLSDVRNTGGRGGVTGVLPGSGQSWVGHLDPRSKSGTKQSSAAFSMETKSQKESQDLAKEQAKASAQLALQQLEIQNALKLAYMQTATVIKANIDSIFPVEKQKLDLKLQQSRHNLLMQGMPKEYIDYEEKRIAAMEEGAMAEKVMKDNLSGAKAELKVYNDAVASGTKLTVEQQANVTRLTGNITALEEGLSNATQQQREYNIVALESAIATMKQADALKAMEEVSGRINDAVNGVIGTYKTLFKEIATGTNSVEALKKAQDALTDQALTMFFDFAMKPVEDFFKKTLGGIFGVPDEEEKRKETLAKLEAQLVEQKRIAVATEKTAINTERGTTPSPGAPQDQAISALSPNVGSTGLLMADQLASDTSTLSASISSASEAFKNSLSKVDASMWNTTATISQAAEEAGPNGPAGSKLQESLGKVVQGIGIAAGSIMGIAAGIGQIKKGGTSNVLGGIGSILLSVGGAIGGLGGLFGGRGGGGFLSGGNALSRTKLTPGGVFANGGIAKGGFVPFRAFANGGTVQGPTLGLMGEGRYNEAIVPLPDGKSIPVQLGSASSRELLSSNTSTNIPPVLSMSFQTTTINGVEYVSRDQLETAMMETRKLAAKDGANRGAALAIDRLQNSPNTRRRIGMR